MVSHRKTGSSFMVIQLNCFFKHFIISLKPVSYTHLDVYKRQGQTGRPFKKRFREHLPKKEFSKTVSNYARHLMDNNHSYTDFTTNFQPLHICRKGNYMNAIEEYEIYKAYKNKKTEEVILNDQLNFQSNLLYDTAIRIQKKRCV